MGIDGIGPRILKHCAVALYELPSHLLSLTLSLHVISKEWIVHSITLILKFRVKRVCNRVRYFPPVWMCIKSFSTATTANNAEHNSQGFRPQHRGGLYWGMR